MDTAILAEIENLHQMKAGALRAKYREVFGEESRSSNRQFLFRRIAWRLQANVEGDLSERARQRALEIADDADLRICAPDGFFMYAGPESDAKPIPRTGPPRDTRLPRPGALITRQFQDRRIVVKVLEKGFEYQSQRYRSVSAIAREITGTRWNGLIFFGLAERSNGWGDRDKAHSPVCGFTRGNRPRKGSNRSSTRWTLSARRPRRTSRASASLAGPYCRSTTTMAVSPAEISTVPLLKRLLEDLALSS